MLMNASHMKKILAEKQTFSNTYAHLKLPQCHEYAGMSSLVLCWSLLVLGGEDTLLSSAKQYIAPLTTRLHD
jgi:hypothetical protein